MKKTFCLLIILFLCYGCYYYYDNYLIKISGSDKDIEVDLVSSLYNKINDETITIDFIKWVDSNYKGSIKKFDSLLSNNKYDITMWHDVTSYSYIVLDDLYNKRYDSMDNVIILNNNDLSTLSFVGDISLADDWSIAPKYDERGGINGILSDDVLDIMNNSTLMVANSEFTVSNRGNRLPGKLYTFRAKPERLGIYSEMGVDLVTLANNHVYDYGEDAFLDMLDEFNNYKIPHIGAGHNIEEARKPFYFIINGYKFAFLSATRAEKYIMTPGATEDSLGVFRCYDPTLMINTIKEIKDTSDYVIPIIHFGREGSHELEEEQINSARAYIDAGAFAVIGHHAHNLQGLEYYNNKLIVYNLGNFIFNDMDDDTAIFQIRIDSKGNFEYYIIPALQSNCYTKLLYDDEKQRVINDLNSWSINTFIDNNGKISVK